MSDMSPEVRAELEFQKKIRKHISEIVEDSGVDTRGLRQIHNPQLLPTDSALFYYPNLPQGLHVFGPISVREMCLHFFNETLPGVAPARLLPPSGTPLSYVVNQALNAGMVVLFGENGILNQYMARQSKIKLVNATLVSTVFDKIESNLVYIFPYGQVNNLETSGNLVGINLPTA